MASTDPRLLGIDYVIEQLDQLRQDIAAEEAADPPMEPDPVLDPPTEPTTEPDPSPSALVEFMAESALFVPVLLPRSTRLASGIELHLGDVIVDTVDGIEASFILSQSDSLGRREWGIVGPSSQFTAWNDAAFITNHVGGCYLAIGRSGGHGDSGLSDETVYNLDTLEGWTRVLNPRRLSDHFAELPFNRPSLRLYDQNDYGRASGELNSFMPNMGHTYGSRVYVPIMDACVEWHAAPFPSGGGTAGWELNAGAVLWYENLDLSILNKGPHPYDRLEWGSQRHTALVASEYDPATYYTGLSPAGTLVGDLGPEVIFWSGRHLFLYDAERGMVTAVAKTSQAHSWGTIALDPTKPTLWACRAVWSETGTKDELVSIDLSTTDGVVQDGAEYTVVNRSLIPAWPEGSQIVFDNQGNMFIYDGGRIYTMDRATGAVELLCSIGVWERSYNKMFYHGPSGCLVVVRSDGIFAVRVNDVPAEDPLQDSVSDPDPAPAPSGSRDLPIGDLAEAQAMGLLPRFRDLGYGPQYTLPKEKPIITGEGGERHSIGLVPEEQAYLLATGDVSMMERVLTYADYPFPWDDYTLMTHTANEDPPGHGLSFAHTPALFWLAYLATGNPAYVHNKEMIWAHHARWRALREGGIWTITGRQLAWQLRNLAQLARLEQAGVTEQTGYIGALEATRLNLERDYVASALPRHQHFRCLGYMRVNSAEDGWSSWMESFIGIVINHVIQLGFEDWRPLAEWHLEHLNRRAGGRWPFKAVDGNHYIDYNWRMHPAWPDMNWDVLTPYAEEDMAIFAAQPDDELVPVTLRGADGNVFTYANRAEYARMWAGMATLNGLFGARRLYERLEEAIQDRGEPEDYKNAILVPTEGGLV